MNKLKKYRVKYFCHIVKGSNEKIVFAETKAKAKKTFKDSFYHPPTILDVELIK